MINKSSKFNKIIKNNYYNKINNNKFPLETKEQEINKNDKNEIGEKTNVDMSRNNYSLLYDKSKISNIKDKIRNDLSYDKIIKGLETLLIKI